MPVLECSLDGSSLPTTPPCNQASYALADAGLDQLINEMEMSGDYFYRTASHPNGTVAADDVIVIKVNDQWGSRSGGDNEGRLVTNTDVLKLWRIVNHPDGFNGEIVIAENTQNVYPSWDDNSANAEDKRLSPAHFLQSNLMQTHSSTNSRTPQHRMSVGTKPHNYHE